MNEKVNEITCLFYMFDLDSPIPLELYSPDMPESI